MRILSGSIEEAERDTGRHHTCHIKYFLDLCTIIGVDVFSVRDIFRHDWHLSVIGLSRRFLNLFTVRRISILWEAGEVEYCWDAEYQEPAQDAKCEGVFLKIQFYIPGVGEYFLLVRVLLLDIKTVMNTLHWINNIRRTYLTSNIVSIHHSIHVKVDEW